MHVFFIEKSMTKEKLLAMPADDYMNAEQHAFFEQLLQDMKVETHERIEQNRIAIESLDTPADPADAASVEEERTWLVNAIDRDQRMLPQLDKPWSASRKIPSAGAMTAASHRPEAPADQPDHQVLHRSSRASRADRQAPASSLIR
jgi:hypothetical protein